MHETSQHGCKVDLIRGLTDCKCSKCYSIESNIENDNELKIEYRDDLSKRIKIEKSQEKKVLT